MQTADVEKKLIRQIQEMVSSRFGKTFELNKLTNIITSREVVTHSVEGSTLRIPLTTQHHFLGTGIVYPISDLSEAELGTVSDLVRTLLEPTLYRSYLERQEENLIAQIESRTATDPAFDFVTEADQCANTRKKLLILYGPDSKASFKFALKIHEQIQGWAFVNFKDIRSNIKTQKDLEELGSMTIFVDTYEDMTAEELQLIRTYIEESERSDVALDGPFILFSISEPFGRPLDTDREWILAHLLRMRILPLNSDLQDEIIDMMIY